MPVTAVRDMILNLRENRQGHAFLQVANDLDKAAAGADNAGNAFDRMRADAMKLNKEIEVTKAKVKDLYVQFARTGDKSLFGDIRVAESDLRKLLRTLENVGGVGASVTNDFSKQLSSVFSGAAGTPGIGPALIAGLVEAAALALPAVGAMLAGGLAGATGTAAMAAGILSAAKDEQVRSAAQQFGRDISAEFFGGGDAFVQPVIDSLDILRKAFADMHVDDALEKIAPTVTVIAEGFADLGRNFMPGFNKALDRMGPLADAAALGLADTGDALGDFLDSVTASKGTVEGLGMLFTLVNGTVRVLGNSIEGLSDITHRFNVVSAKAFGDLEDIFGALGLEDPARLAAFLNDQMERVTGTGESMHGMFRRLNTDAIDPFADYLHEAWEEMDRLREEAAATNKALSDYFDIVMNIDQAQLGVNKGLLEFKEALKENGRHWEENTEAGIANREALLQQINNLERLREAEIAAGGDTGQANAKFYEQVQALLKIAGQAGATKKYLEELERDYVVRFVIVGAVTQGAQQIIDKLRNALHGGGSGSSTVNTGRPAKESFADGGDTPANWAFRVHAGETLFSSRKHYVATAAQTKALMSGATGGSKVALVVEGSGDLATLVRALMPHLRVEVRGLGGAEAAFR